MELTEGVLILKSGSKIYVPNGLQEDGVNKKFNEIIVGEDIQLVTSAPDSHRMFFLQIDINNSITGQWNFGDGQKVDSGDEPEISLYGVWYDISNNIIKISTDGSSWNTDVKLSLPICIAVSDSSNNFVSFDQVFNGFGYLGNTWYVLPGVNVLIPNGFNSDGTYNTINATVDKVSISALNTGANITNRAICISKRNDTQLADWMTNYYEIDNKVSDNSGWFYVKSENKIFNRITSTNTWSEDLTRCHAGQYVIVNNKNFKLAKEDIEEIQNIECDEAFIPIGGTYTMDYQEAAELANTIKAKVVIPTHYGSIVGDKEDAIKFKKLVNNKEVKILIK